MARFWVVAAVIGECCTDPHVKDRFVEARTGAEAIELVKKRLEKARYDVGDCFTVRKSKALRRFFGES